MSLDVFLLITEISEEEFDLVKRFADSEYGWTELL